MSIFTARENFKEEFVEDGRGRFCKSCFKWIEGKTALVVRWRNKKDKSASLAVCNEECWSTYDHNFWITRRANIELNRDRTQEAERLFRSRLPIF